MADAKNNSGISVQQLVKLLHRTALRGWVGFISAFVFISALLCLLLLIKIKFWSFWYLEIMTMHVNSCSCSFIFSAVFLENVFQNLSRCKWLRRIICKAVWKTVTSSFFSYKCKQEMITFFFSFWSDCTDEQLLWSWHWCRVELGLSSR